MAGSWQDYYSDIASALRFARSSERYVDVKFCRGQSHCLYAHRLVLSLWSPKFADWMKESTKDTPFIFYFTEDVDVMESVLDYLYQPPFDREPFYSRISVQKLIQVLDITERLCIKKLHERCLLSLKSKKIMPNNVISIFDYGLRTNLKSTIMKCLKVFATQGVSESSLSETVSIDTLRTMLQLDKISLESEATLLHLVMSWLSHPPNRSYKSDVLSLVDFSSIEWNEYRNIWRRFPGIFTDSELSSILLAVSQQDDSLFPSWYRRRVSSVVEFSCDLCVVARRRLTVPSFPLLNFPKDRKSITQAFYIAFDNYLRGKLESVELSIGPSDIPENEFEVKFNRNGVGQWRECLVDYARKRNSYTVIFHEPLNLQKCDSLHLKFSFQRGLKENQIKYSMPNIVEKEKMKETLRESSVKIELKSSHLAFYCGSINDRKFLVLTFCFRFCDNHTTYLIRKAIKPNYNESRNPQPSRVTPKFEMTNSSIIKKEKTTI